MPQFDAPKKSEVIAAINSLSVLTSSVQAAISQLYGIVSSIDSVEAPAPAPSPAPAPAPSPTPTPSPAPAPAPAPTPAPSPAPSPAPAPAPTGTVLHFAANGDNANDGTEASPKLNLTGIDINSLPADSSLRFRRGDTFAMVTNTKLKNLNVSPAAPLRFEAYGAGALPVLQWPVPGGGPTAGFEFGLNFNDNDAHGGYVFKDLSVRGPDTSLETWGFWCKGSVNGVTVENCDVTNWYMGSEGQGGHHASNITFRVCRIQENRGMGVHGCYYGLLLEDIDFTETNPQASHFVHRVYLRNGADIKLLRCKTISDQPCQSGTFTFHGLIHGYVTLEGLEALYGPGSDEGAWPISLFPDVAANGDAVVGGFENVTVRNCKIRNPGNNGIHVESCPGALIEGNEVELTHVRNTTAIVHRNDTERPDYLSGTCVMQNNVARGPVGASMTFIAAPGSTESNNTFVEV